MRTRATSWLAWSLCLLTVVMVACTLAFAALNRAYLGGLILVPAVISSALVGAVVASRRPGNPVGWFFLASAACMAVAEATFRYATYGLLSAPGSLPAAGAMAWPQSWLWVPGILFILVFLPLYFPDGRLLSRRWRPVLWFAVFVSVVGSVYWAFQPGNVSYVSGVPNPLGVEALRPAVGTLQALTGVLFLAAVLVSMLSLVVRFRRSRGEERQQMKWLTYAAAAMTAMLLLAMPLPDDLAWYPIVDALTSLLFAGIPVAAAIAVLKHRLYDIDRIVNRTLVYAALTASLAAVYLGTVALLQYAFRAFTGEGSQLTVVASTLAIAALFNPLRRRIQALVDRSFYRKKYDAARTLEAFSARLRDATDLDALSSDLVGVVRETVQPEHASLWLRRAGGARRR